jgi:hypothetical protein
MEVSGNDEVKLAELLTLFDEQEDVQQMFTNARGYETTSDE